VRRPRLARFAVPVVLAAAVAAALPAAASAAGAPRCQDKAGDTIARSANIRVFQRVRGTVEDGQSVTWFSCRIGSRAAVHLESLRNTLDGEIQIREAALSSSSYLVLMVESLTGTDDTIELWEYSLTMPNTRLFTFARDGGRENAQIVATRHGGIAFLDGGVVTGFDGAGTRVLAPSGASDLGWGIGGDRVYWTSGAAASSTLLSGHPVDAE
jgi:hypothetical protein